MTSLYASRTTEIEVWRIALDSVDLAEATCILDHGELIRAESFATALLCQRFLSRRIALRRILGDQLGIPPSRVELASAAQGKPRLAEPRGLFFNLSHSGAVALVALSARSEVGIDIEELRDVPRWPDIVREFFNEDERRALLRPDRTASAFLAYWARKEAVAKATGLALDLPLNSFSVVSVGIAGEAAIFVSGSTCTWHVRDLIAGHEHVAALASSAPCVDIRWRSYP